MSFFSAYTGLQHVRAIFGLSLGALFCFGTGFAGLFGHGKAGEIVPAFIVGALLSAGAFALVKRGLARMRRLDAHAARRSRMDRGA